MHTSPKHHPPSASDNSHNTEEISIVFHASPAPIPPHQSPLSHSISLASPSASGIAQNQCILPSSIPNQALQLNLKNKLKEFELIDTTSSFENQFTERHAVELTRTPSGNLPTSTSETSFIQRHEIPRNASNQGAANMIRLIRVKLYILFFNFFWWCYPAQRRAKLRRKYIDKPKTERNDTVIVMPDHQLTELEYDHMSRKEQRLARELLLDLAFAMNFFGCPTYRSEYHVMNLAAKYKVPCQMTITPSDLILTVASDPQDTRDPVTQAVKLKTGSINLSKLCEIDDFCRVLEEVYMPLDAAKKTLQEIVNPPPDKQSKCTSNQSLSTMLSITYYFVAAGCFSVYLNGNWCEIIGALTAGLTVGVLSFLSVKLPILSKLFRMVAAFLSASVGLGAKSIVEYIIIRTNYPLPQVNPVLVAMAGCLILLPGLTFTLAFSEIATNNILFGTNRAIQGLVSVIQLSSGIIIAYRIGTFLDPFDEISKTLVYAPAITGYPIWVYIVVLPASICLFISLFKAPIYPFCILFIVMASYSSFLSSYYISQFFGKEIGTFVAATLINSIANLFNRITRHPSITITLCALIYIVPGSVGVRGFYSLMIADSTGALQAVYNLIMLSSATTLGYIVAYFLLPPKQKMSV